MSSDCGRKSHSPHKLLPGRRVLTVVALVVSQEQPLETRVVEATVPRHVRVFTVRSARTVPPITARRRRVTDAETGTHCALLTAIDGVLLTLKPLKYGFEPNARPQSLYTYMSQLLVLELNTCGDLHSTLYVTPSMHLQHVQ